MVVFTILSSLLTLVFSPFLGILIGAKLELDGIDMTMFCILTTTIGGLLSMGLVLIMACFI